MKNPLQLGPSKSTNRNARKIHNHMTKVAKKRPVGLNDDVFLMNLRVQMQTQGRPRGTEKIELPKGSVPMMNHFYGFNDSTGELRSANPDGLLSHQNSSTNKFDTTNT